MPSPGRTPSSSPVYRSDDGGESFARVAPLVGGGLAGRLRDFVVAPGDADLLFASLSTGADQGSTSSDVWRSTDGGATWTSIRWFRDKDVYDLEVAATDSDRVYAVTRVGLDRSDDGGETWRTPRGGPTVSLSLDPVDEDHLFLQFTAFKFGNPFVVESHDGGETFQGLPREVGAAPLGDYQFDPIDRKALYVATWRNEFLVNRDSGAKWENLGTYPGLPFAPPAPFLGRSPPLVTATSPRRILVVSGTADLLRTTLDLPLCPERPTVLCLDDDRFLVEVAWEDFQGGRGAGVAEPLTADAGTFWFFEPDNVELAVKVLDARAVNGHWWVFFGALTNVEFDLRVSDLATGRDRLYHNPSGRFASRGDAAAFAADGSPAPAAGLAPAWFLMLPSTGSDLAGACTAGGTALCLLDRFRVTVDWQDPTGHGGPGNARPLTSETGWFWFFDPDNPELFVKVLDGRTVNGHWWVFFGSLTDVRFDLVVEDAVSGGRATYHHAAGTFASHGDTTALP